MALFQRKSQGERSVGRAGLRWAIVTTCSVAWLALSGSAVCAQTLRIVPLQPVPGAHVGSRQPVIEFEIHVAGDAALSRNQVNVSLDGRDVSRDLQIDGSRLEVVPRDPLGLGAHQVAVAVRDAGGGRAVDRWTFTVDAQSAAVPTVDDAALADSEAYDEDWSGSDADAAQYGEGYYSVGSAYGWPYGYAPSFFPVGWGPYYLGEPLQFVYTGFLSGGFLTIDGFPGIYPLLPFAPYYYFVTVPVPASYNGGTPVAYCHCGGRRSLLRSAPLHIEGRRRPTGNPRPAWEMPHWRPSMSALTTVPGTPPALRAYLLKQLALVRSGVAGLAAPYAPTPRFVRTVPYQRFAAPVRVVRPAATVSRPMPVVVHAAPTFRR